MGLDRSALLHSDGGLPEGRTAVEDHKSNQNCESIPVNKTSFGSYVSESGRGSIYFPDFTGSIATHLFLAGNTTGRKSSGEQYKDSRRCAVVGLCNHHY